MLDTLGAGPLGDFGDGAVIYDPGTHMAVTPLPTPPSRSDTTDFAVRADDFLGALPTFAAEVNGAVIDAIQQAAGIASSTSATSVTIGTGAKSFTVATGENFIDGLPVVVSYDSTRWMFGLVTSYNSGTGDLVVGVTHVAGSGTFAAWRVVVSGTPANGADVQEFTSPGGTWTKPANRSFVRVELLGAGGGGGAGQAGAVSASRLGGGGGGGGCKVARLFNATDLASTETVTVGIGGAGGTAGGNGGAGGAVAFGAKATASGGSAGNGVSGPGAGGNGGGEAWWYEMGLQTTTKPHAIGSLGGIPVLSNISTGCAEYGGAAGGCLVAGTSLSGSRHGGSSLYGGPGGGAGGGYNAANTYSAAGDGGACNSWTAAGGGAAGLTHHGGYLFPSTAGAAGGITTGNFAGGGGGGGGAANYISLGGTGSVGGAGGRGAGGGGGGATTAASGNGANGGAGGDGFCRVTSW